jgi:hypothetical protein
MSPKKRSQWRDINHRQLKQNRTQNRPQQKWIAKWINFDNEFIHRAYSSSMTHLGDTEGGKDDRFPGIGIARITDCVGSLAIVSPSRIAASS